MKIARTKETEEVKRWSRGGKEMVQSHESTDRRYHFPSLRLKQETRTILRTGISKRADDKLDKLNDNPILVLCKQKSLSWNWNESFSASQTVTAFFSSAISGLTKPKAKEIIEL